MKFETKTQKSKNRKSFHQVPSYISKSHFLSVIDIRNCRFALADEMVVQNIIRQAAHSCKCEPSSRNKKQPEEEEAERALMLVEEISLENS